MQSTVVAMLVPEGGCGAALFVRRANGQSAFQRIDARVASAARVAADFRLEESSTAPSHLKVSMS